MRRLKRSSERAAAASIGLTSSVKFNASRRIPSWNCIARENSASSIEEDLTDVGSSLHQGAAGKNWKTHHPIHDGSDSESESVSLNSWTRSGGPLMRTTSANKFIDFVQNLEVDTDLKKGMVAHPNSPVFQHNHSPRVKTTDRSSEGMGIDQEADQRLVMNGSSIMVTEGDLLQPERIQNGIVLNVVKKEDLTALNRSHDFGNYNNEVAGCLQIDCPGNEMNAASVISDCGVDDSAAVVFPRETPEFNYRDHSNIDVDCK